MLGVTKKKKKQLKKEKKGVCTGLGTGGDLEAIMG